MARLILLCSLLMTPLLHAHESVVLLHGLARSSKSMSKLAKALKAESYNVVNLNYPSTKYPIEQLAERVRAEIVAQTKEDQTVHLVTHSMGGILLRQIQKTDPLKNIGRVVMLSPPNQGSEVVDKISARWIFKRINGPAGQQLGTQPDGFVASLGPVDFELGVLTGDRSINWINSSMIPGKDDGKVSIESAKVEGMQAYKIVHATHPMIMRKRAVIEAIIHFLQNGQFLP